MNEIMKSEATKRKYSDIINIKHFEPKHPRMDRYKRASQCAPFAALTGYEDLVRETSRLTNSKPDLSEDEVNVINDTLIYIENHLKDNIKVSITYFEKDKDKEGGSYKIIKESIKKIDSINKVITLKNGIKLDIDDIINILIIS